MGCVPLLYPGIPVRRMRKASNASGISREEMPVTVVLCS